MTSRMGCHKRIKADRAQKLPPNERAELKVRLDKAFGEYIKLCGNYRCIIPGMKHACADVMQPNHLLSRSILSLRWDEDNAVCGCSGLNTWAFHNKVEWDQLWRSLWPDRAVRLDAKRQKAEYMDTEKIRALVEHYEKAIEGCKPK
jgi:hypothetical protein